MTSEDRHKQRRLRRELKRKKIDLGDVFSYSNLYQAYKECRKNVSWKASTQLYITNAPVYVYETYQLVQNNNFRSDGFYEFDILERGKPRHIRSVTMRERVVQRCLCDNALVPAISRTFIYDNSASQKGKGYHFALKRLKQHLRQHIRKYGRDGYILIFDFSKFFDSVSHDLVKQIVRNEISDEKALRLTDHFVDAFGESGLGLGSQVSQILALASANRLDHYVKEILRIKGCGRYMDDGYLLHHDKSYLKHCLSCLETVCAKLGISLNLKKTRIVKLSHGFTYMKVKHSITLSGRIVTRICRKSAARMRHKLKFFRILLNADKVSRKDVYSSWQSWRAYALHFNSWTTIQATGRLYNRLFLYS